MTGFDFPARLRNRFWDKALYAGFEENPLPSRRYESEMRCSGKCLVAKLFRFKLKLFSFFNPTLKLSRFIEKSNRFRLREILILFFAWGTTTLYFLFSYWKMWELLQDHFFGKFIILF
ncbi:hypothetical protein LEP1GSC021_3607 [Leptospira noguchii str. 1993005606]|uniref:Uncharacterized protein n=1 Tax=Leptospira noguchii str. 2007001578 TaxID=1049974 RepID=A0ABP2T2M7_9LEPT|nr:hypothetical protein LEP1GSC035_1330 [Leptospira noguchii str. 2007001578]EPE84571.1 hypothetical protein LEP1GSC021_3607 [Leptospira noguchii str. 1993005606]